MSGVYFHGLYFTLKGRGVIIVVANCKGAVNYAVIIFATEE